MADGERPGARNGGTDDVAVERLAPDEAFGLVAHETRLGILETLNDADEPLAFSELRERVGVDDAGQFNYHLGELAGRFVRRRDEGYRLSAAGRRVVGAVLSGGYTHALDGETVPVDGTCNRCGGGLEARFRDEALQVGCSDCGFVVTEPRLPPGVLSGWPREDAAKVADRWLKRNQVSAAYGFCYNCDGRIDRTVRLPGDEAAPEWFAGDVAEATVVSECRRCGHWWHAIVSNAAVVHPAVAAFHHDHGIDVRETPTWDLDWTGVRTASVASEDPLRVEVPVTLDGETRVFVFDDALGLVEERGAGSSAEVPDHPSGGCS